MKAAQVTTAERSFTAATRSLQKVHELNGHKRHLQQRPLKFCTCQFLGKFFFAHAGRFRKRFHEGRRDLALILAFGAFEPPEGTRGASVVRGYTRHLRTSDFIPRSNASSLIVSIFVSSEGSSRPSVGRRSDGSIGAAAASGSSTSTFSCIEWINPSRMSFAGNVFSAISRNASSPYHEGWWTAWSSCKAVNDPSSTSAYGCSFHHASKLDLMLTVFITRFACSLPQSEL
jgi:hypothetical protein